MSYTSFEQIDRDLVVLQLRRKIAVEELKGLKNATADSLDVSNYINPSMLKLAGKLGLSLALKKMFKMF